MATGEGGKSNFADTGGYGGNFNAGGGGLYNTSASAGGNPTTLSGGVGDYGALAAAASRVNTKASSMNSSANQMMRAAGYVLNKNGVWSTPAQAYQGTSPATRNMTDAEYNAYVAAYRKKLATVPPVVAPPVPTPRPKPFNYQQWVENGILPTPGLPSTTPQPGAGGFGVFPGAGHPPGGIRTALEHPNNQGGGWAGLGHDIGNSALGWGGMIKDSATGLGGMLHDATGAIGNAITGENRRQFGGPVAPGQQYTVGENGPETLQMGANGGGQVIPHNPMDRMGGMNPQMMQQMFQMMRQYGGGQQPGQMGQGGQRIQDWLARRQGRPMPGPGPGGGGQQLPPGPGQMMPPAQGPGTGGGGWGFGGSGMGVPGIMSRFGGQTQLG